MFTDKMRGNNLLLLCNKLSWCFAGIVLELSKIHVDTPKNAYKLEDLGPYKHGSAVEID